MGIFPNFRGENKKSLKPPPSSDHDIFTPLKSNSQIPRIVMFKGTYLFQGPSFWGPPAVRFRGCRFWDPNEQTFTCLTVSGMDFSPSQYRNCFRKILGPKNLAVTS